MKTEKLFFDKALDVFLPPADDLILNGHFEQGAGTITDWIASGTATPTLTTTVLHTGQRSVVLGTTILSPTALSGDVYGRFRWWLLAACVAAMGDPEAPFRTMPAPRRDGED